MDNVEKYIELFLNMKRAPIRGYKAPHKPILLLAIIELIERKSIISNRIVLDKTLIQEFTNKWYELIDDNTQQNQMVVAESLVIDVSYKCPFKCSIENPFFYLNSEPFWRLVPSDQYIKKNSYSCKGLQTSFKYAEIDKDLFNCLYNESERKPIKNVLIDMI